MNKKSWLLLATATAVALIGPESGDRANAGDPGAKAQIAGLLDSRAVSDPKRLRYIISGVRSTAAAGTSTFVHCTNLSNVTEIVQFALKGSNGALVQARAFNVLKGSTIQIATRNTELFDNEDYHLAVENLPVPVDVDTGVILVQSTTAKLACTAGMVDSELNNVPQGLALHLVRANSQQGWID